MSGSNTDPAWPLMVFIDGSPVSSALMNRKAYRKSLETGVPWIVHPAGRRVLPWPGEPRFLSLREASGRFELELPIGSEEDPYGKKSPPDVNPDDRTAMSSVPEKISESGGPDRSGVMAELSELIAERHRTMPEGSYTTHLFEQGLDKILKKTGEEAVELLLARNEKDVIYESADLVYHLLVMLEASGLSWGDVTEELARRHSE